MLKISRGALCVVTFVLVGTLFQSPTNEDLPPAPDEPSAALMSSIDLTVEVDALDAFDVRRDWNITEVREIALTLPTPARNLQYELGETTEAPQTPTGTADAWVEPGEPTIWLSPTALAQLTRSEIIALILHEAVHVLQDQDDEGDETLASLGDTLSPSAQEMLKADPVRRTREAVGSCLQPGDRSGYREAPCSLNEALQVLGWLVDQVGETEASEWWPWLVKATGARVLVDGATTPVVPTPELLREIHARAFC